MIKGFLYKKGSKFKSWRQRFFTLNADLKLSYYLNEPDSQNSTNAKGALVIQRVTQVKIDRPHSLSIEGAFGNSMIVSAETESVEQDWLMAISRLLSSSMDSPALDLGSPRHDFLSSVAPKLSQALSSINLTSRWKRSRVSLPVMGSSRKR